MYSEETIAKALDLAVLKTTASPLDVQRACEIVSANKIRTICVAPTYAKLASNLCVPVCAVVGFPHGTQTPTIKAAEARELVDAIGVEEIDVVLNYGRYIAGDVQAIKDELEPIIFDAHDCMAKVKAILEVCYLDTKQIYDLTRLCCDLGVDFVKTSTGFGVGGATPIAVKTMVEACVGYNVQVKASGGITCYNDAAKYLDLGCTRLGSSRYKELLP